MDYQKLIDAETWAFIHKTESFSADTSDVDVCAQRANYNRMCKAFHHGYPQDVTARDMRAGDIPLRVYECADHDETMIYFHGGGFVVGGLESHDDVCAELCSIARIRVVSVDYRLCPENPHPAAFQDGVAAAQYVALTWPGTLILAGDSAGANLAAATAHATRGELVFAGSLLIYPGLGGDTTKGSYQTHAFAPLLSLDDLMFYENVRFASAAPVKDPTAYPLADDDFSALPPTVVFTAACDPLADDGRDYRDALVQAGGKAHWIDEDGLVHGYLRARHSVKRAADSFARIAASARMLADGRWEY